MDVRYLFTVLSIVVNEMAPGPGYLDVPSLGLQLVVCEHDRKHADNLEKRHREIVFLRPRCVVVPSFLTSPLTGLYLLRG